MRTKSTLLRDIQDAATDASTPLSVVLRKTKVLAARLDHQPLKDWVGWELDGYPNLDVLPAYRQLRNVQVLGDFSGAFGSGLKNAPIPPMSVPEELREFLFNHNFVESAGGLEPLASHDTLYIPWPADAVAFLSQGIYQNMVCLTAQKVFSGAVVVGILEAVRNKVLAFALEIEAADPDAGEAEPGQAMVPEERVTHIINTTIYGGQNNVAAGNRDVQQSASQVRLDWDALESELRELGLGAVELDDLQASLQQDAGHAAPGTLGPATEGWLGRLATRVGAGSLALASGVTVDVVAHAISKALGA